MDGMKFIIIYLCIESIKFLAARVLSHKEHLEILRGISENQRETAKFMKQTAEHMAHIATFRCPYKLDNEKGVLE
jgi:hypothetical protein